MLFEGRSAWQWKKESHWAQRILAKTFHRFCASAHLRDMLKMLHMIRLDYLSCVLTVLGQAACSLVKKLWQAGSLPDFTSAVVCVSELHSAIRLRSRNLLCIALYTQQSMLPGRPQKSQKLLMIPPSTSAGPRVLRPWPPNRSFGGGSSVSDYATLQRSASFRGSPSHRRWPARSAVRSLRSDADHIC